MTTQTSIPNTKTAETPLLFTHETVDGVTFVTLTPPKGKLIEEEHIAAVGAGIRNLILAADTGDTFMLEFENVAHLSSAFLATLTGLKMLADRNERSVMLCRLQPQPMSIMDLTRFRVIEIELTRASDNVPSAEMAAAV